MTTKDISLICITAFLRERMLTWKVARVGAHHGSLCQLAACDAGLATDSLKLACADYTIHLGKLVAVFNTV